ncbi:type IV pilus modification protein PilV [Psychromonas sp.]|uniref:type IV pilus modification protein PilV n=1 Tax=Psychromonas sp. TaxID=1884585 RepID=UPI003562A913
MDKNNQIYHRKLNFRKNRYQQGSSLLEILVAVFILAIGLLGLAALQANSLKNINNSQFRTLATTFAYDMAERMRSNQVGISEGGYDAITASVSKPSCGPCTPVQLSQRDGYQWNQQISLPVMSGGLPTGSGTVTKINNDPLLFAITVAWQEQQRDSSGGKVDSADFTLTIQP